MRTHFRIRLSMMGALFLLTFWATGSSYVAHALEILVKERATLTGDTICLGDIASFDPEEDERVPQLSGFEIGAAPSPGKSMGLNHQFLIYRIRPALAHMEDIKIKVPQNLMVHREAHTISPEKLKEIFRTYILENSPWPDQVIKFEKINASGPVLLPKGQLRWETKNRRGDDYVGDVSLVVSFWVDGQLVRKVPLTGKISVKQPVIRTARKISAGQIIHKEDLTVAVEHQLRIQDDVLTKTDEVVGKTASRSLQEGQLITGKMVQDPPLVEKGDRVIIKAENPKISVTTFGKVMEDGRAGDQVRVVNIGSGKEILATVMAPGQVAVSF